MRGKPHPTPCLRLGKGGKPATGGFDKLTADNVSYAKWQAGLREKIICDV